MLHADAECGQHARAVIEPVGVKEETEPADPRLEVVRPGTSRERRPGVRAVRDVPEARARSREIPVQHQREAATLEQRVPRRPVVVADHLRRNGRHQAPASVRGWFECGDGIVIAAQ